MLKVVDASHWPAELAPGPLHGDDDGVKPGFSFTLIVCTCETKDPRCRESRMKTKPWNFVRNAHGSLDIAHSIVSSPLMALLAQRKPTNRLSI
jgi:hypothetical protein